MPVDLCGAEEAHVHATGLQQVTEDFRQWNDAGRGVGEFAVADRKRQHVRARAERAGFVDQHDVGRVRETREIARGTRQADADEADTAVPQQPRGSDGHHLVAGPVAHATSRRLARNAAWSRLAEDVPVHPGQETIAFARDRIPALVEAVVARVMIVHVRRIRAARALRDGTHDPVRQHDAIHGGRQFVDDFLDRDDQGAGSERGLALGADDAVHRHVAAPVRALCMQDRDVGIERGHRRQSLARERALDAADARIDGRQVGAEVAAQRRERQPGGAGAVGRGHAGVGVLVDLERRGPLVLDGIAQPMQRADARDCRPTRT